MEWTLSNSYICINPFNYFFIFSLYFCCFSILLHFGRGEGLNFLSNFPYKHSMDCASKCYTNWMKIPIWILYSGGEIEYRPMCHPRHNLFQLWFTMFGKLTIKFCCHHIRSHRYLFSITAMMLATLGKFAFCTKQKMKISEKMKAFPRSSTHDFQLCFVAKLTS